MCILLHKLNECFLTYLNSFIQCVECGQMNEWSFIHCQPNSDAENGRSNNLQKIQNKWKRWQDKRFFHSQFFPQNVKLAVNSNVDSAGKRQMKVVENGEGCWKVLLPNKHEKEAKIELESKTGLICIHFPNFPFVCVSEMTDKRQTTKGGKKLSLTSSSSGRKWN